MMDIPCFIIIILLSLLCELSQQSVLHKDADFKHKRTFMEKDASKKNKKWLTDSIVYDDYQADAPMGMTSQEVCPPVPQLPVNGICPETNCTSDIDCSDNFRCCFTGCAFTCVPEVKPAAVVDWLKEPKRSRSGISWLIDGPIKISGGINERCSTTPVDADEDPLLCPHGYFCHVIDPGKPKKGIPNSGYCVKQTEQHITPGEEEIVLSAALQGRKTCTVDKIVLLDGANIRLGSTKCRCRKGQLSCSTNKDKPDIDVEIKVKSKKKSKRRRNKKGKRANR